MTTTADATLLVVAPAAGTSGVGDYVEELLGFARARFGEVREVRFVPGGSLRDVVRSVREVGLEERRLQATGRPYVLHCEFSAGELVPFWSARRSRAASRSGTLHDAPRPVWWPLKTAEVARSRVLGALLHLPFNTLWARFERRALRGWSIVTLSRVAADRSGASTVIPHFVVERDAVRPLPDRPLALGLFGYVYPRKGFDRLATIRSALDPEVDLVVAGRGTQHLDPLPGVRILGPVEGDAERAFFESVRAVLLPYAGDSRWGPSYAASGTAVRAVSWGTPVVGAAGPVMDEYAATGGMLSAPGDVRAITVAAAALIRDDRRLGALQQRLGEVARGATPRSVADRYLAMWSALLEPSGARTGDATSAR